MVDDVAGLEARVLCLCCPCLGRDGESAVVAVRKASCVCVTRAAWRLLPLPIPWFLFPLLSALSFLSSFVFVFVSVIPDALVSSQLVSLWSRWELAIL